MEEARRALVLLAAGAEEIEVTVTVDVLRRAGVEVLLAGVDGPAAVSCSRGVVLTPDAALEDVHGTFDVVVLPGGLGGTDRLCAAAAVGRVLKEHVAAGRLIAAICAAPLALVHHGVCGGSALTSHPSVRDGVEAHGDYREDRVVEDGDLITSRGPGTAFEFALAIAARLSGQDKAHEVAGPLIL